MYEPNLHSLLTAILDELRPEGEAPVLRCFYTRLGANFAGIFARFQALYGQRDDFQHQCQVLVKTLAEAALRRPHELMALDQERERDPAWFLSQRWVGMALYANGFAENLADLVHKIDYFCQLGVNLVHVMPILKCPRGRSDGGYAISDFREIDDRAGSFDDFRRLASAFRQHGILLALDIVLNHTSDEHEWAQRAKAGKERFQDYDLTFPDRSIPDRFEQAMPEVFPQSSPGNFTWNASMQRWVMTVFHDYQWDLNYANPEVFIAMLDTILFWANEGVDVLRLDAVAFLWKRIGSSCQNDPNVHQILALLKDCCQVSAPAALFIAEAIVAPSEVVKYFGADAISSSECDVAYNATLMALLWEAIATKNARLLTQGVRNLPAKPSRTTWLNYARCHDDIGFGFDDQDIRVAGYDPLPHRRFLADYFTGVFDGQPRGLIFNRDEQTGAARICGTLASLVGLESALETGNEALLAEAIQRILLLHGMIFSFGGIPLLFNGDAVGTLNDYSYGEDPAKRDDSRWVHRGGLDWEQAARRNLPGTIEHTLFSGIQRLIAVRASLPAFADLNNRSLLAFDYPHLLGFLRLHPQNPSDHVLVMANFDVRPHRVAQHELASEGFAAVGPLVDQCTGVSPHLEDGHLIIPPLRFHWLTRRG